MNKPRNRFTNRRRSTGSPRSQGLLEVKVRSELLHRQRNHAILVWACKIALAAAVVVGAVVGVRTVVNRMFLQNPDYNLAAVEINSDGSALSREVILETAKLTIGENIFKVSLSKAREAILTLPQVERVELQRALPNRITIDITERRPVAWLADPKTVDPSTSDKSFLVDSKGVLFKPKRQLPEYLRLPAIYGADVEGHLSGDTIGTPELCAALELVQKNSDANRFRLQSIDLSKGYCLIATDARRARLTFGLEDIGRQLDRLGAVLDYAASQGKELRTVNLMVEKNIPAVLADPGAPEPEVPAVAEETSAKAASAKAAASPAPSAKPAAKTAEAKASTPDKSSSVRKRFAEASASSSSVKRAEPNVRRAEPVVRRAEPVIRRAEPVNH